MIRKLKANLKRAAWSSEFGKSMYRAANRLRTRAERRLSDEAFARRRYRERTGRDLDLNHPTTFNEKLWWLKLNNRDPALTQCSDKVAVREFVREKGLEEILIPQLAVYDREEEVIPQEIPAPSFLKMSNTSGFNMLWNGDSAESRRRLNRTVLPGFRSNYYWQSREWNYKGVVPRLVAEQVLPDSGLVDYRFLCFSGRCEVVFVDIETADSTGEHFTGARRNVYDREFHLLDAAVVRDTFPPELVTRPERWDEMIQVVEQLAEDFPFCRVDLYFVEGRIYFGEMTFYPGGGMQIAKPEKYEQAWGDLIDLDHPSIVCA